MSVNTVIMSGVARKVWDEKLTKTGTRTRSMSFEFTDGTHKKQVNVSAFGDRTVDQLAIDEGTPVLIQGRLNEQRWKKDDETWDGRVEVNLTSLEVLSSVDAEVPDTEEDPDY